MPVPLPGGGDSGEWARKGIPVDDDGLPSLSTLTVTPLQVFEPHANPWTFVGGVCQVLGVCLLVVLVQYISLLQEKIDRNSDRIDALQKALIQARDQVIAREESLHRADTPPPIEGHLGP